MKKSQYQHQDLIHNPQMLPIPHLHQDLHLHHSLPDLDREDQAEVGEGAVEVEEEEEIKFLIDYLSTCIQLLGWSLIEVGYRDSVSSKHIQPTTIWISLECLCQIYFAYMP